VRKEGPSDSEDRGDGDEQQNRDEPFGVAGNIPVVHGVTRLSSS
jgi:hypothetical protein